MRMIQSAGMVVMAAMGGTVAIAQTDLAEVEKWQPVVISPYEPINPQMHTLNDEIVAENDKYIVIRQDGGRACPAGVFWLVDKVPHRYRDVNAGSCDESLEISLTEKALVFTDAGKITAKYPLY